MQYQNFVDKTLTYKSISNLSLILSLIWFTVLCPKKMLKLNVNVVLILMFTSCIGALSICQFACRKNVCVVCYSLLYLKYASSTLV